MNYPLFSAVLGEDMRQQLEEIIKKAIEGNHPDGINLLREGGPSFVEALLKIKVINPTQRATLLQMIGSQPIPGVPLPGPINPIVPNPIMPHPIMPHPIMPLPIMPHPIMPHPVMPSPMPTMHVAPQPTTQSKYYLNNLILFV